MNPYTTKPHVGAKPDGRSALDRTLSHGLPSKPLAGLPLARWIPQDVHSMMDYANGLVAASCVAMTDDPRAREAANASRNALPEA